MAFGRFGQSARHAPSTDRGDCVYVIGDVHGRYDLMAAMFDRIEQHMRSRSGRGAPHLILLGDLVDRGPDSAGVLEFVHDAASRSGSMIVLRGNHEELMLRALSGEPGMMRAWLRMGGDATLRSYGVAPPVDDGEIMPATKALAAAMPGGLAEWLRALPLTARSGDYLFCHAGIRPGVAIKRQNRDDLLWIRGEFLDDETDHGVMVVHGHTITPQVDRRSNRIGIDTGAYRSGILTALYLENSACEILSVQGEARKSASADPAD